MTLTWTGATSQYMTLYRDGVNIGAAANTGTFLDVVVTSGGTVVSKVCGIQHDRLLEHRVGHLLSRTRPSDGAGPYNRGQRR